MDLTDSLKLTVLVQSLKSLNNLIKINESSSSNEVLAPILSLLKSIPHTITHQTVRIHLDQIAASLVSHQQICQEKRVGLKLQNRKQMAIKSYAPKFHSNFAPDKHYDPDRERSQTAKQTKEFKQEFKGAVRELRKDAAFINNIRREKKRGDDAAYKRKIDGIMGNLASQEGAMRGYEREVKKAKGKKQ